MIKRDLQKINKALQNMLKANNMTLSELVLLVRARVVVDLRCGKLFNL